MEKEFYLIAPENHHYELGTLIRQILPFTQILAEAKSGVRGIVLSEDETRAQLFDEDGGLQREVKLEEPSMVYQGEASKNWGKRVILKVMDAELPWGILTGVRPSKVAYAYLEDGRSELETEQILREDYLLREDKAKLCTQVAASERLLLQDHKGTDVSIYAGIPFCPTRCSYCSFISNDKRAYDKWAEQYVDALVHEMDSCHNLLKDRGLQSFYMGGGTPTTLDPEQLKKVLQAADRLCHFAELKEVTVEAGRPDTITPEKLQVLKAMGVTRISINPQTMIQRTLDVIGRKHSVEAVEEAFWMAREAGFDNINMDFIVGLPGEGPDEVRYSMERVKKLRPDNLTVHTLAIKRSSKMNEEGAGLDLLGQARQIDEMISITAQAARELGMEPYYMYRQKNMAGNFENVGYSLPGKEGLYNIEIMEERQTILAFGAGGVSKVYFPTENRLERVPNVKGAEEYIRRIDEMIGRKQEGVKLL